MSRRCDGRRDMVEPPRWNNEDAVANFINDELDQADEQALRNAATRDWRARAPAIFAAYERDAIEAAERGNFRLLAELLDGGVPGQTKYHMSGLLRAWGQHIGPKAEHLIAERLRGKTSGRRRRPALTTAERQAKKVHYVATVILPTVESVIRQHYPHAKAIHERAADIAADRAGIKRRKLRDYLRHLKKSPEVTSSPSPGA